MVKALFTLAKALSPSIIFVDEIDSLLSSRSGGDNENEASRRLKTEFFIQWSSLASAAAARTNEESPRVLVLAATNLPWAIDDAARRRFVLRQYIPLPGPETRRIQFGTLLSKQHHTLTDDQLDELVTLTEGPRPHLELVADGRIFRVRYYCVDERCGDGSAAVIGGGIVDDEERGD